MFLGGLCFYRSTVHIFPFGCREKISYLGLLSVCHNTWPHLNGRNVVSTEPRLGTGDREHSLRSEPWLRKQSIQGRACSGNDNVFIPVQNALLAQHFPNCGAHLATASDKKHTQPISYVRTRCLQKNFVQAINLVCTIQCSLVGFPWKVSLCLLFLARVGEHFVFSERVSPAR